MSKPAFIPGLKLSEEFFLTTVQPILSERFPRLSYSAALIGPGSEVLGFDNEMSSDHHWGPRVMLFLDEQGGKSPNLIALKEQIKSELSTALPYRFMGYPTSFTAPDGGCHGVQLLDYRESGAVNHRVELTTISDFFLEYLGFDPQVAPQAADWCSFPEQKLRSIVSGKIFHDQAGLQSVRERFQYYPRDVWLYMLASAWVRIEQEEHLMGRAGTVGDELGSAVIAARLVRDLMRLMFLMERVYAPYPKWFGTAFKQLQSATELQPTLLNVLHSQSWQERERYLVAAYEYAARLHNALAITEKMTEHAASFHDRPFLTISRGAFSGAIARVVSDATVSKMLKRPPIGNIDQFTDSTDLLADAKRRQAVAELYADP